MSHKLTELMPETTGQPNDSATPVARPAKRLPSAWRMLAVSALITAIATALSATWVWFGFPLLFGRSGPVQPAVMLVAWAFTLGPIVFAGLMVAIYLLPKRPILGFLACLVMTGIGVEIGLRLCIEMKRAGLLTSSSTRGWATQKFAHWAGNVHGYGYIDFHTEKDGFRQYGDRETTKTKLLVIGDSYTHGHRVSDGDAYFERIAAARPDVEVFAYGCMGYSSYQQYLFLDEHIDEVQPDVILWQFCQNDFIHNLYELESASLAQNNHIRRPYLENGKPIFRYPKETQKAYARIVPYSSFLRYLDMKRDVRRAINWWSVEGDLNSTHSLYLEGADKVAEIMGLVKKRAGKTPVVAFSVDSTEACPWIGTSFSDACDDHGISYMHGIAELIDAEREKGRKMDSGSFDNHWNADAHGLAAEAMLRHLEQNGFLKAPADDTVMMAQGIHPQNQ